MQPDDARAAEAAGWLSKAALDLKAAEFDFTAQPPLTADIVFHCQQLAEKSMKALLVWHDVQFRKTHNLLEVGLQCAEVDPTLEDLMRRAAPLTEYAWKFRYPGDLDEPAIAEAEEALAIAREVYEVVLNRLPRDARP